MKVPFLELGPAYFEIKEEIDEAKEVSEHHSENVELQEQFPNIFNKQNSSVNDPYSSRRVRW